jgi:hypothetical protein
MVSDPLSVTADNLKQLSANDAVNLLHDLLWAEAARIGIAGNLIDVPSAITVGDGGVDAQVADVPSGLSQGIIKDGYTAYQVKTGDFSLGKKENVDDLLFVKRKDKQTGKPTPPLPADYRRKHVPCWIR